MTEQEPADPAAACGRVDHQKIDEVPAEEVSRPDDHEAADHPVCDLDLTLTSGQGLPDELGPLAVAVRCQRVTPQHPVQVARGREPGLARNVSH